MAKIELALGLVVDFGGMFGSAEGDIDSDTLSDIGDGFDGIGDSDGGSFFDDFTSLEKIAWYARYAALSVMLVVISVTTVLAETLQKASEKASSWYNHLAFYVGPLISFGPFYITGGACLGGFGCLAIGGGIKIGNFGIGILVPIWIWW